MHIDTHASRTGPSDIRGPRDVSGATEGGATDSGATERGADGGGANEGRSAGGRQCISSVARRVQMTDWRDDEPSTSMNGISDRMSRN